MTDSSPPYAPVERLARIAAAHYAEGDGDCAECGWKWPCQTYRLAASDPAPSAQDGE